MEHAEIVRVSDESRNLKPTRVHKAGTAIGEMMYCNGCSLTIRYTGNILCEGQVPRCDNDQYQLGLS